MTDFKVGDRVEYVGTTWPSRIGQQAMVVEDQHNTTSIQIRFDGDCSDSGVRAKSIRLIAPAPDVITINRADLPEARIDGNVTVRSGTTTCHRDLESSRMRSSALERFALAEFLEAREKAAEEVAAAEKESAAKLDKRRDELAELFTGISGKPYHFHRLDLRTAIDRIIELEASDA